ncbi:hypothetical protein [Mucilaginibacter defluvii]|uniref:Uncharacterized protein n=1 Tax=Mucilaginibacter defluvii TaxID=1196019 RepID=A0ABP9FKZ2_9SPHI
MDKLIIKDMDGKNIKVTDLNAAIRQADRFKYFNHVNPSPAAKIWDRARQAYWNDLYEKLKALENIKH